MEEILLTGKSHGGSFGDAMKTQWVYLEKRLVLRTHVVVSQAASCLKHAKLRWDAENGWQELRAFYSGRRGEYLREVLRELILHGGKVVCSEDGNVLHQQMPQGMAYSHYFTPLLSIMFRFHHYCRFKQNELDFITSCLSEFSTIITKSDPPSLEIGRTLIGAMLSASYCVKVRSGFMPQTEKSARVERIFPPPGGTIYTYEEIVSSLK